jgi:hypothetical protein
MASYETRVWCRFCKREIGSVGPIRDEMGHPPESITRLTFQLMAEHDRDVHPCTCGARTRVEHTEGCGIFRK